MSAISTKIMLKLWFGDAENIFGFTIDDIFALFKKEEKKDIQAAIKRLKREEFIKQKQDYNGSVLISLSERGRLRALNAVFRAFDRRKEKWDGKWRIICFDIPDARVKGRKALAYRLKMAGFYKVQESVFVFPYNCEKEIKALARLFDIEKYVWLGLLEEIDNQAQLMHHFKL